MASPLAARIDASAADGAPPQVNAMGWMRLCCRVAVLLLGLALTTPPHYIWRLLRLGSPWPRLFLALAARCSGARIVRRGTPLKRDVFYVANHVSWIDICAMGATSGTAFVSKAAIAESPIVGWMARQNRTVFVKREDKLNIAEQINELRDALADNWAVTIFPEATTSDGQSLLPFKTSMLKVLEPPPMGVLVQPVHLDYGAVAEEIGWIGVETGTNNAIRILSRARSFPLVVTFLEPFNPADFPGRKAIAAECRARIEVALVAALGRPLRPFTAHSAP